MEVCEVLQQCGYMHQVLALGSKCIVHSLNCGLQGTTSVTPSRPVQPWLRHRDAITSPDTFQEILEHGPQPVTLSKHQPSHSDVMLWYKDSADDKSS